MNFETTWLANQSCGRTRSHSSSDVGKTGIVDVTQVCVSFGVLLPVIFPLSVHKCSNAGLRDSEESALCPCRCTSCVLSDGSLSERVSEDTGKTDRPRGPAVLELAFRSPVKDVARWRHEV